MTITDPKMIRFMMDLDEAVKLVYLLLKRATQETSLCKNRL